jgi:tRNA (guanine-N7-)-methyltransferase
MALADIIALTGERRRQLSEACAGLIPLAEPFTLEIGSGHGHFLTAYASAHPNRPCIGIDLQPDRVARANRKRERARCPNLRFLRADADDFLAILPESARFSECFLLFPDPWPKRRHHKNRLMRPEFLERLAARAGEGARLYFRTDHEPYFTDAQATIRSSPSWREVESPWPLETPTVFQQRAPRYFSLVAIRKPESIAGFNPVASLSSQT